MQNKIEETLARFESLCETWHDGYGSMRRRAPFVYLWTPPHSAPLSDKPIGLTLQAITHGNEVGGILSLLELLRLLKGGLISPSLPLAFILGNPAAAVANRRFLEGDLNRSFGMKNGVTLEAQRAEILAPILAETRFLLDFHQTIEASIQPFFIFPFTPAGLDFARSAHSGVPVVTHWGKPFSLDGMCTDEFVNFSGGTGITIELGKKGFDPYQTSVGLQAALGAIAHAESKLGFRPDNQPATSPSPLYTWKTTELYEQGMDLREGLYNFQAVTRGEIIGVHGARDLVCKDSGWLLFPKYHRDPLAPRAREIYRIAKSVTAQELGQPGVVGV